MASGKYETPDAVPVRQLGEDTYTTPDLAKQDAAYAPLSTPGKVAAQAGAEIREARNQGLGSTAEAAVGGAVSGVTAGLLNPFEEAQEFHPWASGGGQLVGAIAPALVGDEAGLASLLGDGAAVERGAGSLSSKFLYAGERGAEAGTQAASLEGAMLDGGRALDDAGKVATLPEDLTHLDAAGLRTREDAELERLATKQKADIAAARAASVDDALAYQQKLSDANPYLVTGEGPASAPFAKAGRSIRNALDDVEGLRDNPGSLLKPLRTQAGAIEKTLAEQGDISAKFERVNTRIADDLGEDLATLPDSATHVELAGKAAKRYGAFADVRVGKAGTVRITRDDAQGFLGALQRGEVQGAGQQALGRLGEVLDANKALQAKIKSAVAPAAGRTELASADLTAIRAAKDALTSPKSKSLAEEMLGGSIMGHVAGALSGMPIVGPMIGAKAGRLASDLVFGKLGATVDSAAARSANAAKAFAGSVAASTTTLPLATAALARARFAPAAIAKAPETSDLAELYRQRTAEVKSQTMYDANGNSVMRPEARQAMAARLAPLRAISPILADRYETIGARGLEYLSQTMPRQPDLGTPLGGTSSWTPADMAMREWARRVAAVEDPHSVELRISDGSLTPEDVEAYHAVYPERAAAFERSLLAEAAKAQKPIPFEKRLTLSMFTGRPMDPSLDPRVLGLLQAQFSNEEGTEGGTRAPVPKPAFGSVRSDLATASQERESAMR
ncbi:MAG TPA: hypothetical protein VGF94_08125 [Kofleriaceae bacterium]